MKKISLILTLSSAFLAFAFTRPASTEDTKTYKVDPSKSTLVWTAKKVTGEHTGNISLAEGSLKLNGQKISEGNFIIDMTSITCTDITDKTYNEKFIGHLNSEDFFSVEKFKESKFVITSVKHLKNGEASVKGALTIKGITHNIEFPAKIKTEGNKITTTAKITVDRSKYDIRYGSKSFFEGLGDKMIYDEFELDLKLVANS